MPWADAAPVGDAVRGHHRRAPGAPFQQRDPPVMPHMRRLPSAAESSHLPPSRSSRRPWRLVFAAAKDSTSIPPSARGHRDVGRLLLARSSGEQRPWADQSLSSDIIEIARDGRRSSIGFLVPPAVMLETRRHGVDHRRCLRSPTARGTCPFHLALVLPKPPSTFSAGGPWDLYGVPGTNPPARWEGGDLQLGVRGRPALSRGPQGSSRCISCPILWRLPRLPAVGSP